MKKNLQDFYGDLVHKHGWRHVAPLLSVIPEVESEIHKRKLTAFTSHEILRVTPHEDRAKWLDDHILSIAPDRSGVARVIFQSKQDRKKLPIWDFLETGGSAVSYETLVTTIIPYLEKLAQEKTA